jgi:hypothetical protein
MKAHLIPIYFESAQDPDFTRQLQFLREVLLEEALLLEPFALGENLPTADAVIFPQMLGNAYRMLEEIRAIKLPILVVTSEFATMSMWDWEINAFLASAGVNVIAPYNLEQTRSVCRALSLRRELPRSRFLVYQDNPGEGFQPEIFKRFYWWENECTQTILDRFGIEIVRRSFRELGQAAQAIPDQQAQAAWEKWKNRLPLGNITHRALLSAIKIYLAVSHALDEDPHIQAVGINCLNESHFSDTTPCLAWNMLFEERELIWGCEADTLSMLTKMLLYRVFKSPVMMTNLYPFLMGQAALKHEHIPNFPEILDHPENCILTAHCGYLGVVPQSFATDWKLQPKVLAIVDENATAIDANLPTGPITLVKLDSSLQKISVVPGELLGYAQFPNSHCLNGAVIRVNDGHQLMSRLLSHHYIVATGDLLPGIRQVTSIFDLSVEVI